MALRAVCFHQVLQDKLKQSQRLAEMYRDQCITLESELAKVKEEGDATREIFQVPSTELSVEILLPGVYTTLIIFLLNRSDVTRQASGFS